MDTSDLRIFIEIYHRKSISRASRTLFSTQSTLSRRIAALEKELGLRLFERSKGIDTVELTPEGTRFLPLAEKMLELEDEARSLTSLSTTMLLSLGMPDSMYLYQFRGFVSQIMAKHPELKLDLRILDSNPICARVAEHTLDVGLINGTAAYSDLNNRILLTEKYVVLMKKGLTMKPILSPGDLKPEKEVYTTFSSEDQQWHNYWWKPGLAKAKVNLVSAAVSLLQTPGDWTIIPESAAHAFQSDSLEIHTISESPDRIISLVTHKKQTLGQEAVTQVFTDALLKYIRQK